VVFVLAVAERRLCPSGGRAASLSSWERSGVFVLAVDERWSLSSWERSGVFVLAGAEWCLCPSGGRAVVFVLVGAERCL
jgi:hypothetical protein